MTDYSSKDFWKGAPDWAGAVIGGDGGSRYWVAEWGIKSVRQRLGMNEIDRFEADMTSADSSWSLIATRPTPQWSGDCLPPVGTRLECQYAVEGFTTWHAGECVAVGLSPEGEAMCVIKAGETISCYRAGSRMRPIKTPAQIAAEEREAGIQKMLLAVNPVEHLPGYTYQIVSCLYDAGLRFPKGDDQ